MSIDDAVEHPPARATTATAPGVVELDNDGRWPVESEAVRSVLAESFGAEVRGGELVPPTDPAALRARLRAGAPAFADLAERIRRTLDAGACGVLVTRLGLAGLPVDARRTVIFALAALLGDVAWTHPVDRHVIADIRSQDESATAATRHSSFSENDREAMYHTDASYAAYPDRYFLLYSARPAECGGGQTFLTDGRALLRELDATEQGRAAVATLREAPVPMRVPKAYRDGTNCTADGYQYVPLVGDDPLWRFRQDKIEKGLAAKPEYDHAPLRDALDVLYRQLDARTDEFRGAIPADAVLLVDNHVALHGRTAFDDSARHLLRARWHRPRA